VAAVGKQLEPRSEVYFVPTGNLYEVTSKLASGARYLLCAGDYEKISDRLCDADLLCISSMSPATDHVSKIAAAVKKKNRRTFILWGGAHPMLYPQEAIEQVDAICISEGETAFRKFYHAFSAGKEYSQTPGMWFRMGSGIIKNPPAPLSSQEQLNSFPHLFYGQECQIFDYRRRNFRDFSERDYIMYNGFAYRTILSMGCAFSCSYCANSGFLKIDPGYRALRYPSVDYIIDELKAARRTYPFISTVVFYDDNFIALPFEYLKEFALRYAQEIRLPFVVFGLHPNFITEDKIALLAEAGMNRGRMGIQSGSKKILDFYNRATTKEKIIASAEILARAARKYRMIPPAYDIISDNPLETGDDIRESLAFIYGLKRPFTLTIFSLRAFAKTALWEYFENHPENDIRFNATSYLDTRATFTNILLYLLAIAKPPPRLFFWLLKHIRGNNEKQRRHLVLHRLAKSLYFLSRGLAHLRRFDFSNMSGAWLVVFYNCSLVFRRSKRVNSA
jgi:radical SAM superfamily enzyme YgiQ (UPF0313 family)